MLTEHAFVDPRNENQKNVHLLLASVFAELQCPAKFGIITVM
jgi:hypothetical protein